MNRPLARLLAGLLALGVLGAGGCASVPSESQVTPLKKISEGQGPALPPGPGDETNPLDLVRGFVNASGSSENRHAAARRFLTASAQNWDDSASLTVLAEQFDTVYAGPPGENRAVVRLRGQQLGRITADGSFSPAEAPVELDVEVSREDGQWRIDGPPSGTVVRLPDVRSNYKKVRLYFVDPIRHSPVADLRHLALSPARSLPARVVEQLLGGPSDALSGAAVSAIPRAVRLRSNVATSPDGTLIVDLTELGNLDEGQRWLLAAQIVLSVAEVNVSRVRLLDDGAPLLAKEPVLSRETFADLENADDPRPDIPGLVVVAGKARPLMGTELGAPLGAAPGVTGLDLAGAIMSPDGQQVAVVNRQSGRSLLVGKLGGPLGATGVQGAALSRPSWAPTGGELWCVRNTDTVIRLTFDGAKHPMRAPLDASSLTALGPITDLRLSRDGLRVAAIASGRLVVGALARSTDGGAVVRNVRMLHAGQLTNLITVDWRAADQLAVAGRAAQNAVAMVSVDGLDLSPVPTNNLTPPLTSIASSPGRPLLVTDQNGLWSFGADDLGTWRQLYPGAGVLAGYPG